MRTLWAKLKIKNAVTMNMICISWKKYIIRHPTFQACRIFLKFKGCCVSCHVELA